MILIHLFISELKLVRTGSNYEYPKELYDSVKQFGVLNPIIVRERTKEIIDGRGRYLAAKAAGHETIPCYVYSLSGDQLREYKEIEPEKYVPISKEEYKKALQALLERFTIKEISEKIGKSEAWIKDKLK